MNIVVKNKNKEKISVVVDKVKDSKGLAFVAHGLGGFKEQPHIKTFARAFNNKGYTVVRWDARKSIGKSEGELIDATLSNYFKDFETVVEWSGSQSWYKEPFVVCGHSLGAACSVLFAKKNPAKVKALAPFSLFVGGKAFEKRFTKKELSQWKKTGIREWVSSANPDLLKRLKWDFMIDAYRYDLLEDCKAVIMPTLLIVGSKDYVTVYKVQKQFYKAIPAKSKQLNVIEGSEHTFSEKKHIKEIQKIIEKWMDKIGGK